MFDDLTALTTLRLNDNDLASLPADVFDDLTALTTLRLNDNDLASLPNGVLENLTSLTELLLSGNPDFAGFIPTANAGGDQVVERDDTELPGLRASGCEQGIQSFRLSPSCRAGIAGRGTATACSSHW